MTYKLMSKPHPKLKEGQVTATIVDIKQEEPYTIISRTLEGDHTNASDDKLVELVLEKVHKELTPKENLVQEVNDLKEKVAQQSETIKQALESNQLLSDAFEELSIVVLDELVQNTDESETTTTKEPEEGTDEEGSAE